MVPRTSFDPQVHGFAFANSWQHPMRRPSLCQRVARYRQEGTFYTALTFALYESLFGPRQKDHNDPSDQTNPPYGLCAGMCFAALDFYYSPELTFPRGDHLGDQPGPGTALHSYLWKRQLDSLIADGVQFLTWVTMLNRLPSGPRYLLKRSRAEWTRLKARIAAGDPIPLGLVREAKNVFDNHQVLAIGYEEQDGASGTLMLYDPNCPDRESTVDLQFGESELLGRESCEDKPPLRGFFRERYRRRYPAELAG
jgi:hypothetical protein